MKFSKSLNVYSLASFVVVANELQLKCNFWKSYIGSLTFQICKIYNIWMHFFKTNDIWNKQIEEGLALKIKPKIK